MSPLIVYRRLIQGRSLGNFQQRFLGQVPALDSNTSGPRIWLHAVSVGEVNLLAPIIDRLQQQYPVCQIAISTTTATGMQLARQKYAEHTTFFFPIDFSWAMKSALKRIQPDLLVFTELELWPNLIRLADQQNVPVTVVNGRLSESSFGGYRRFRWILSGTFERLALVTAQNDDYAKRFIAMGCRAERVHAVGSIKFDNANATVSSTLLDDLRDSINMRPDDVLFVAGSTQLPEESLAAKSWLQLREQFPQLRLVIVPRHPHNGPTIKRDLLNLGVDCNLRSENSDKVTSRNQVLIADTIGELTGWWSLASIAFVGGSFGKRGGQNMIEPAACGANVCFGPKTKNFRKVVEQMRAKDVATVVNTEEELQAFVRRCLNDPVWATRRGAKAKQFVDSQRGAIDRTIDLLQAVFDSSENRCLPLSA